MFARINCHNMPSLHSQSLQSLFWPLVALVVAGGNVHADVAKPVAGDGAFPAAKTRLIDADRESSAGQMDDFVRVLLEYNGVLIAGGDFTTAGGTVVHHIAGWDGTSWSPLMGGTNSAVWTLAIFNGELIVGGRFTTAGSVSALHIARWDGSSWSQLGSGVNGTVGALMVHEDKLIVGGDFTEAGGIPAGQIAQWDGTSWSALGTGFSGGYDDLGVRALAVYEDRIIAGGHFIQADGAPVNRIAQWDGVTWEPVGNWTDDTVYSLILFAGQLIAGSVVWSEGTGNWENMIHRWDGHSWISIGSGQLEPPFPNAVFVLSIYDGRLFAGGPFIRADGIVANCIAQWIGEDWGPSSHWAPVGLGMNSKIRGLTVFDNKLFAGGLFTTAGGQPADRIAYWDGDSWHALGGTDATPPPVPQETILGASYPNPFRTRTTIRFSLSCDEQVNIRIHDISGRHVKTLLHETVWAGTHSVQWDGTNNSGTPVSSGIYFYHIDAGDYAADRRVLLLR